MCNPSPVQSKSSMASVKWVASVVSPSAEDVKWDLHLHLCLSASSKPPFLEAHFLQLEAVSGQHLCLAAALTFLPHFLTCFCSWSMAVTTSTSASSLVTWTTVGLLGSMRSTWKDFGILCTRINRLMPYFDRGFGGQAVAGKKLLPSPLQEWIWDDEPANGLKHLFL